MELVARTIAVLRERRREYEAIDIVHAAVLGSVARGDADDDSDVDVLIELAPHAS